MAEVEVTAEMVEAGRRVLEDAVSGCPESIVSASHLLGDYLVDAYRAMRAVETYPSHCFCAICGQPENGLTMKQCRPCPRNGMTIAQCQAHVRET